MPQRARARGDSDTTLTSRTSARSTSAAEVMAAVLLQSRWRGRVDREDLYWDLMGYGAEDPE